LLTQIYAEQANGYIIYNNADTAAVTVYIPVFYSGHLHPLEFQKDPNILVNGKKQKVNLGKIQEIGFDYMNLHFVFRKVVFFNGGKATIKLKHLINDGKVKVFRNYFKPKFKGNAIASEVFLINEERESHFPKLLACKKKIRKFLRGCPKFDATFGSKKFRRKEIPALIAEYNGQW